MDVHIIATNSHHQMLLTKLYKPKCFLKILAKEKLLFVFDVLYRLFALPEFKSAPSTHGKNIIFLIINIGESAKIINGLIMCLTVASLICPFLGISRVSIETPHGERFVR